MNKKTESFKVRYFYKVKTSMLRKGWRVTEVDILN